jgi:hypothetical protein
VNWIYQILRALLDWFRETPPTDVNHGKAPDELKQKLGSDIADLPRLPDEGGPGPFR